MQFFFLKKTTLDLRKEFLKSRFACIGSFHTCGSVGMMMNFLIVFVCALLQCSFIMRKFEDAFSSIAIVRIFVCLSAEEPL